MIVGAAVVPTTPLLVDGVTGRLPDGLPPIRDAVTATLDNLPRAAVAVLIAGTGGAGGGPRGTTGSPARPVLYAAAEASLAGIGRPDLSASAPVALDMVRRGAVDADRSDAALPLDLAVLVHLVRARRDIPVLPVAVPRSASAACLLTVGAALGEALAGGDEGAVAVAAGDLSAGRTSRAPLAAVPGAAEWDDEVVDIVASGRLDRLTRLGPEEAARVGARAWAPLVTLHALCRTARLGMVLRTAGAPRGVGYLVASGG